MSDKPELLKVPPITESALASPQIYAIGLVAAEWGYAESTLESLIWALAEIDINRGRSITTHLNSVTRQEIAKTLANETLVKASESALRESVIAVVGDFEKLRVKRNKIIHAVWMLRGYPIGQTEDQKAESLAVKAKGKLEVNRQLFDPTQIRDTALEITALIVKMSAIVQTLPKLPDAKAVTLSRPLGAVPRDRDPKRK